MPFTPFHERFPEIAKQETRGVFRPRPDGTPGDGFAFVELFCNERGCDCRRVVFQVNLVADNRSREVAMLSFGWEPESFYRKWASYPLSRDDLDELKGPAKMRLSPQSDLADEALAQARVLLSETSYVQRIVRHYEMFRAAVDGGRAAAVKGWRSMSRKSNKRAKR